MKFKKGQEVVIKKNLGKENGYSEKEYYYSGNINKIPIGSRGEIQSMSLFRKAVKLKLNNGKTRYFHYKEIEHEDIYKTLKNEEEEKKQYSKLERAISEDLLNTETEQNSNRSFNPVFNVREEYAIWIQNEFPDLKEHAKNVTIYPELEERKEEVLEGAEKAYKHAMQTTTDCIKENFKFFYKKEFKKTDETNFSHYLNIMCNYIIRLSSNLDKRNIK